MKSNTPDSRLISFSGRVQGVGFRMTCRKIARGFDVRGWVRNERDGTVTLAAAGTASELDAFLAAIAERMGGNIKETRVQSDTPRDLPATGFEIRR